MKPTRKLNPNATVTLAAVDPFASYASTDLAADLSLYDSSLVLSLSYT